MSWPIASATPWAGPLIVGRRHPDGHRRVPLHPRHPSRPPFARPPPQGTAARRSPSRSTSPSRAPTRASSARRRRRAASVTDRHAARSSSSPPSPSRRCCSPAARRTPGRSSPARPTPSPTATVIVPEGQQAPAVTKAQAERIIARIAATAADADAALDATLAATRLDGAVLAERATNYTLRGAIADYTAPAAIPTKPLEIVLPQAYDGWPRSVMAVVNDEEDKTASIMLMTQEDAWSPYKLTYLSSLEAATQMPDLAPAYVGAHAGAAGLVVPGDGARSARGRVRRRHQQGRGQRVLRPVRGRGRPVPRRASPPTASSASRSSTRPAASTGSLTFDVGAGRAPAARARDARERRDRRRERQRGRHRQADERRRGHQARRTTRRSRRSPAPSSRRRASPRPSATSCSSTCPGSGSTEKIRLLGLRFRDPRREGDQVDRRHSGRRAARRRRPLCTAQSSRSAPRPVRRCGAGIRPVAGDGCHGRDLPAGARALAHGSGRHRPVGGVVRPVQAAEPHPRAGRHSSSAVGSSSRRSTSTPTRSCRRRSARSRSRWWSPSSPASPCRCSPAQCPSSRCARSSPSFCSWPPRTA